MQFDMQTIVQQNGVETLHLHRATLKQETGLFSLLIISLKDIRGMSSHATDLSVYAKSSSSSSSQGWFCLFLCLSVRSITQNFNCKEVRYLIFYNLN